MLKRFSESRIIQQIKGLGFHMPMIVSFPVLIFLIVLTAGIININMLMATAVDRRQPSGFRGRYSLLF